MMTSKPNHSCLPFWKASRILHTQTMAPVLPSPTHQLLEVFLSEET